MSPTSACGVRSPIFTIDRCVSFCSPIHYCGSAPVQSFTDVSNVVTDHGNDLFVLLSPSFPFVDQDFLSGTKRLLGEEPVPWKSIDQFSADELDKLGERVYNTGKEVKATILNSVEPVILKVFGRDLQPKSGRGLWDADEQLRTALWRQEQGIENRAKASGQGAAAQAGGIAKEAAGDGKEAAGAANEAHEPRAEDAVGGGAGGAGSAEAAPAAVDAADAAVQNDDDDDDPERAPDDYQHSEFASIRLYSTFCRVFGFEPDNSMKAELDPDTGGSDLIFSSLYSINVSNFWYLNFGGTLL